MARQNEMGNYNSFADQNKMRKGPHGKFQIASISLEKKKIKESKPILYKPTSK